MLAFLLLGAACNRGAPDDRPPLDDSPAVDDSNTSAEGAKVVVWLTIDTLNERYLGHYEERDTTPNLDELFRQSVVFENTYVAQGVTIVSLPTIATGQYPRTHRIWAIEDEPDSPVPMIQTILDEQGWTTWAYSSNFCLPIQHRGWDKAFCTAPGQSEGDWTGDLSRDQALVDELLSDLEDAPEEKLFIWLHLRDPHITYTPRSPWIDQWWTEEQLTPLDLNDLDPWALGEAEPDETTVRWIDAVYASQVASSDAMLGTVIDKLKVEGLYADAVIVHGTDHGEEMGWHNDYWYHGCSMYEGVLNTTWSVRAPGGQAGVVTTPVSAVDIVPTTLALAGVQSTVDFDGRSLAPALRGQELEPTPVFFERAQYTAGVVMEEHKYWRREGTAYDGCWPFTTAGGTWEDPAEGFFDVLADPMEVDNLAESVDSTDEHTALCTWITEKDWRQPGADLQNPLVQDCVEYLDAR